MVNISAVVDPSQARAVLSEALSIIEQLAKEGKLTAAEKDWPDIVRTALAKLQ